jgi:uncharacterized protein
MTGVRGVAKSARADRKRFWSRTAICVLCALVTGCASDDSQPYVKRVQDNAAHGDAKAQHALGLMYYRGEGVSQDRVEAAKWFRRAAEQGLADGETSLGRMYTSGSGVAQDYALAVHWFRKAADQSNATGQNLLGEAYHDGRGVPQDFEEAVRWYRRAAEQGSARGQFNLGESYRDGEGVQRDLIEAHKWMNIAASHTLSDDEQMTPGGFARGRDELTKRMTPEQTVEAQRRAREWVERLDR